MRKEKIPSGHPHHVEAGDGGTQRREGTSEMPGLYCNGQRKGKTGAKCWSWNFKHISTCVSKSRDPKTPSTIARRKDGMFQNKLKTLWEGSLGRKWPNFAERHKKIWINGKNSKFPDRNPQSKNVNLTKFIYVFNIIPGKNPNSILYNTGKWVLTSSRRINVWGKDCQNFFKRMRRKCDIELYYKASIIKNSIY